MKGILVFLLVSTAYIASGVPVAQNDVETVYPRFMEIPGDDGEMHLVDLEAEPDYELLEEITRDPANNRYYLYTRRNPTSSQTLTINNAASVTSSNFNANLPTYIVAHGWLGNQNTDLNPIIRDAALRRDDCNVIILDWRRLALSDYVTAARGVPAVGVGVGQFLLFLNAVTGVAFTNMHLVGFSLGAHLMGNAGRTLNGRAARVSGLDPAGPLWTSGTARLTPNDGIYVEAIHTDGGVSGLGIGSAVADADFFPNGGNSQPGCLLSVCNHNRAWELFAATLTYDHLVARRCTTSVQVSLNTCIGAQLRMGNSDLRKTGNGLYRVNTGRSYPY